MSTQDARLAFDIQTSCDPADLDRLRPEWNELCLRANAANPFLECDWFRAWWQGFGGDHKLQLITIRREGQLQGILPLMLSRAWVFGIPCRRLGAINNDHTPRFDLVFQMT